MHAKTRSLRAAVLAAGAVAAGLIVAGCGKKDAEPKPAAAQPAAESANGSAAPPSAPAPQTPPDEHAAEKAPPADEPTKLSVKWDDKMPYAPEDPYLIGSPLVPHLHGALSFLAGGEAVDGNGTLTVEAYKPAEGGGPDILLKYYLIEPTSLGYYKDKT